MDGEMGGAMVHIGTSLQETMLFNVLKTLLFKMLTVRSRGKALVPQRTQDALRLNLLIP